MATHKFTTVGNAFKYQIDAGPTRSGTAAYVEVSGTVIKYTVGPYNGSLDTQTDAIQIDGSTVTGTAEQIADALRALFFLAKILGGSAPLSYPLLPSSVTTISNTQGVLAGTNAGGTYANYCNFKQKLAAGKEGGIEVQYNGTDAQSAIMGMDISSTANAAYPAPGWTYGALISSGAIYSVEAGVLTQRGLIINIGDWYRIYRYKDGSVKLERLSLTGSWQAIYTYTTNSTADLFPKINIHSTGKQYYPGGYGMTYVTPFTLTGAKIVADGNSKTVGTGSTTPATDNYLSQMAAIPAVAALGATFTNKGVNSQTTQQMQSDAITDIDALVDNTKINVLIVQEIENDIYFSAESAETNVGRMIKYIENRKRAGWDKVILKSLAFRDNLGGTAGGETQAVYAQKLIDSNTLIYAGWKNWGVDALVDLRSNPKFQSFTDWYASDHVHYNTIGYGGDAQLTAAQLLALK